MQELIYRLEYHDGWQYRPFAQYTEEEKMREGFVEAVQLGADSERIRMVAQPLNAIDKKGLNKLVGDYRSFKEKYGE